MLTPLCDGRSYRLIGIGVSEFADPVHADPDDLVDDGAGRRARAERAVDALRSKFGKSAVELGLTRSGDIRRQRDR